MAEINAKDLTAKTSPASTDSMLLFGTTSNEGAKITVDNLADNILGRLATKTFPNQVGGSSAATILAQLATLNSNITAPFTSVKSYTDANLIEATGYVSTGSNAPFNYAIIFTMKRAGSSDDRLQFASGLSTAHHNKFAWRACNSGTWGNWYQLVGTEIVPASST